MLNMTDVVAKAAARGHQVTCDDHVQCVGPNENELRTAATVLAAALPEIFREVMAQAAAVLTAMENGHYSVGAPDATHTGAEELLREWFHKWRSSEHSPDSPPGPLHVATVAYLAAQAVAAGRKLHSAADV